MPQYDEGRTVRIIAEGCREEHLNRTDYAKDFLLRLVDHIGMHPVVHGNKEIVLTCESNTLLSGVSATRIIAESHVAIHTWPEQRAARVLIDSCKDFLVEDAVDFVKYRLRACRCRVAEVREA